ncbi:hypothetical protein MF672_051050 (plasmid) [Actinomadura sp. ATCC 31491]|uniref:DUF4352 domain-containing protein n=1 Tax=Actinomadura luzonensis TaxID=2805427 RepID=A0ABT0GBY2_9ACTN|nr:hypothetical protein [Actinomadura luzonensis]MCK2222092.1 hypothetical protein [Actinomadura luzonensis]
MRGPYLALLAAAALIITGCSTAPGRTGDGTAAAGTTSTAETQTPPAALEWGQPGDGKGERGQPLQITPLGVYYHKGHETLGKPNNEVFTAVAVKVAASGSADHLPPPATGFGFTLLSDDGESVNPASGASPPWVGRVNEPNAKQDIRAGRYQKYVITFDAPSRGGALVYTSPDGQAVEWPIPERSGGQGLRRVLTALDDLGVTH